MGRASATELKRALVDADNMRDVEIKVVDEVANQCGVWMVLDQAPHVSIAGTSAVSAFNEKVLVDLFFLGDVNPVRALDPFLKYSLLARGSLQRPPEVRGALAAPWIIVCGKPRCVRKEERSVNGRNISLQFQGEGARLWLLEGRSGLARVVSRRLQAECRSADCAILNVVQFCLNAMYWLNAAPVASFFTLWTQLLLANV